jgi:2-polyprenyl-3-methyl-5-hydroxy-6-metoxy-1,4-benzoquinol methylase
MRREDYDEAYYEANGQSGDRPALRYYARLAKRYLNPTTILDVGCGTGHLLARLGRQWHADGLELSAYSAAVARTTSPTSSVFESAADLPAGKYNAMTAIHVVEHIPDDALGELLKDLRRASTPTCRALIVTPDPEGKAHTLHGEKWNALTDRTHINLKSSAQWTEFFRENGMRVLRCTSDGLWNFPYSTWPVPFDALRYGLPMAGQFLSGRMLLKPGTGESSLFVVSWEG